MVSRIGIIVGLIVCSASGVAYYRAMCHSLWTAQCANNKAQKQLDFSKLSESEKNAIQAQLDRVYQTANEQSWPDGRLDASVEEVWLALVEASIPCGVSQQLIDSRSLDDEDKLFARRQLERYSVAFITGNISEEAAMNAESLIRDYSAPGFKLRSDLTVDEIRSYCEALSAIADDAGIRSDYSAVDPVVRITQLVDRAIDDI